MYWNLYNGPILISCILLILWGFYIYIKNKSSDKGLLFLFICLFTFLWQLSFFIFFSPVGSFVYNTDLLFNIFSKVCYFGIIGLPVIFLNFTVLYTENYHKRIIKILLFSSYFITLVFEWLLLFTNLIVDGYIKYDFGVYPKAGFLNPLFWLFVASMTGLVVYIIMNYWKQIRERDKSNYTKIKSLQVKTFLFAIIFYVFSSVDAIGDYGIAFYPAGYIFISIFLFIIGYSIVSYRLMDIKLVLRQSTVFLSSLLATVIPIFIVKSFIQSYSMELSHTSEIVVLVLSASLFPILKEKFGIFANKYLFTSLYDSKVVIRHLTTNLSATLETKRIYQSVVDALADALHAKSISFWQFSPEKNTYSLDYNKGLEVKDKFKVKASKNIFNSYFKFGKAVSIEELKNSPFKKLAFIKDFSVIGIEVIVPLLIKDKLIGIICFGPKLSGDIYNNEDFDLLRVISSQVAISLENAFLYEETKQFNLKLSDEVEKATKDLRVANEELKNLDRAKSEFISIASHQLRTPLTVIKGYGSMMLEGSFGQMSEPIKDNVKKIYESNERLITLVEDLLNISRIESGKLQFNFEPCQLEDIVASVVEELAVPASNKGLKLIWHAPTGKLPAVSIDKSKLRQVAINIIDNAIKYTPKGQIDVTLKLDGDNILFSSVDTGLGIAHNDLINLFKKFSRGEHVSILHTEGTGLGLYVGKMMIEAHHGKIWAASDGIDKGSQFYFTLPISK